MIERGTAILWLYVDFEGNAPTIMYDFEVKTNCILSASVILRVSWRKRGKT